MKKYKLNGKYVTEDGNAPKRKFPIEKTILLIIVIIIQLAIIVFGFNYEPQPQDVIHNYNVTVEPLDDGSLDIEYHLVWEALDEYENLTWVEIGLPNNNYYVYEDSLTSNIDYYSEYISDDYVYIDIYFNQVYNGGDKFEFSFKINQKDMLCMNQEGYFYEFVPCWFNSIQVKEYNFICLRNGSVDYSHSGSLDYGEYHKMTIQYGKDDFNGCNTTFYIPFNDDGAYNELSEDKTEMIIACCLISGILVVIEIYFIDSHVSYKRGRGFLSGYGHYVHTFGRTNPHYIRAYNAHTAVRNSRFGGRGGGGCACACACACAGGGRAGCSQKDTIRK